MNSNFPRIITLLRKERGLSQKQAAADLQISQALLSHYEKGIRECGLDFVVRAADYYEVSCDYLLGRTPDRTGATLTVEDIPEPDAAGKENAYRGSLLPTLNKKLIANSLNIIFDILQKCNSKGLTTEVSSYLMLSVYKMFRLLYSANGKNPQGLFAAPPPLQQGMSAAAQLLAEANALCIASGNKAGELEGVSREKAPALSPEVLSAQYPLFASSLYNLIQNAEARMGIRRNGK
jgi:transcriptional regulator with XRE-family HTH domain